MVEEMVMFDTTQDMKEVLIHRPPCYISFSNLQGSREGNLF